MEIGSLLPNSIYGGMKKYWRRRHYQHLNRDAPTGRKKMNIIRLKGNPRKFWRIRAIPKLRWVMRSLLKTVAKVKNGYMNFMLRLAGKVGALKTDSFLGSVKRIPKARQVSKVYSGDAFEARLIFEISKTLVASNELKTM
ncbi:uncharacterized protein LOC130728933 [Lotus japonicus]|uniref:uncharacterized protein LOC130728933 n=1 Tax=Lotus japonicus TaxID=34305 RepID=UPI002588A649|nr:uncharacterized protein LOC130728933 [Lotus japonicus]